MVYTFGLYVLDVTRRKLSHGGEPVALTPKAFDILTLLVRRGGQLVEKDTILREVWPDTVVDEGSLTFQISTLRKALGGGADVIATVPGRGYQLASVVQTVDVQAVDARTIDVDAIDAVELVLEERSTATITTNLLRPLAVVTLGLAVIVAAYLFVQRQPPKEAPPGVIRSFAVLPFKPLVAAQRDEGLELGMSDALIARLSTLRNVTVRPLTAVRRYAGLEQDPIAAGRALGVDAVLDGSILSTADRIRVHARLLRVSDGQQLWQGQFDSAERDIFALQGSMSQRIASSVAPNISADQRRRLGQTDTTNMEAYRAYVLGRVYAGSIRSDRYDAAIAEFNKAIELDESYAKAWAALGDAYARQQISSERPSDPSIRLAKNAALRALAIDPENADAHGVLGVISFFYDWRWDTAEEHFRRAVELNPSDGSNHIMYAHLLSNVGRHDDAERLAIEALRLEPESARINTMAGQFYLHAERYPQAERQLLHSLAMAPDLWVAHLVIGKVYERTGRRDLARRHYETAMQGSGDNVEPLSLIGYLDAIEGKTSAAEAVIDKLLKIRQQRYVTPAKIALPYAGLKNEDDAFLWLRRACQERDVGLIFIDVNPRWREAGLRDDPRWREIRDCVRLP